MYNKFVSPVVSTSYSFNDRKATPIGLGTSEGAFRQYTRIPFAEAPDDDWFTLV